MITLQAQSAALPAEIVVRDPKMIEVVEAARKVALHKAAVLITGETGTGKELIARIIHQHSNRCAKPWVDLNCAALPEHLVESELFGYEKGAFSGADSAKPGLFESANGGTLFLDEIGELEPKVQVKLLRALDAVPYYRLGGNRKVSVDVRVIAATNRDLEAAVRTGLFRSDLYHRISEVHLDVPPLRERPQDIPALAEHFLACSCPDASFTPEALQLLVHLEWRGNVRELRNLVLKLGILSPQRNITPEEIRKYMRDQNGNQSQATAALTSGITTMTEVERLMIMRALDLTGGNQSLAAQHLGIPRRTFCRKLNEYHITFGRRSRSSGRAAPSVPALFRAELDVPVHITTKDGRAFSAQAKNLSIGGLGLQDFRSPDDNSDELTFQFTLPSVGKLVEAKGLVAWSEANAIAGIRFTEISKATADLVRAWIAQNHQADPANPRRSAEEIDKTLAAAL